MKRTVKDSTFRVIFKSEENRRKLISELLGDQYGGLPITEVTLNSVVGGDRYNDLGLLIGDSALILTEAQTTLPTNIAVRMLTYVSRTYEQYCQIRHNDLFSGPKQILPTPYLYTVYTGSKSVPSELRLSSHMEQPGDVELRVQVISRNTLVGTELLEEYIAFCDVCQEVNALPISPEEYAAEVIRRCKQKGILVNVMEQQANEINSSLYFDLMWERHLENLRQEGIEEGRQKGLQEGLQEALKRLIKSGYGPQEAERLLGLDKDFGKHKADPIDSSGGIKKMKPLE